MKYYIYKLHFRNGCTYIGEHIEKNKNDGYITSSSYYMKHKDLLEKREIILECKDVDTMAIMETICIMADKRDNPKNVNHNLGAYHSNSDFCLGRHVGEANPFYGKNHSEESRARMKSTKAKIREKILQERSEKISSMPENLTKQEFAVLIGKPIANIYKEWKLYKESHTYKKWNDDLHKVVFEEGLNKQKFISKCKELGLSNIQNRWLEYNKGQKIKHYWFYNPNTLQETYLAQKPSDEWIKGRLPYQYWSDERKKSYRENHKINLSEEERKEIWGNNHSVLGKVRYTNGDRDIFLLPGQNVPEGFHKGSKQKGRHPNHFKGLHWIINSEGKREWQKK